VVLCRIIVFCCRRRLGGLTGGVETGADDDGDQACDRAFRDADIDRRGEAAFPRRVAEVVTAVTQKIFPSVVRLDVAQEIYSEASEIFAAA
jgi:hypothetical protein